MCGIIGLFRPSPTGGPDIAMQRAMTSLSHRGPDDGQDYRCPTGRFHGGFRRLSIIDLETGDQPLVHPSENLVLIGNGEIYNYVELKQELADHPYRTSGDMEVALAAFAKKGVGFTEDLNGMFAIAVYDRPAARLHLVRDRFGVKPLYWAPLADGGLLFASEIKALFNSGLIDPEVDESSIAAFLSHGYVPAPGTLYKGVNKLPPGHILSVDADGSRTVTAYWSAATAPELPADDEIPDYLLGLLDDSVRMQLRSDVPVGALLSGGIDSGLMVALAAQHAGSALNTFSVRFEGSDVDETPLAAQVAARYGTNHTVLQVGTQSIIEHLANLVWYCDDPINDAALLPNYLIEKALGEHVTVALNGSGGDELFAGYGRYFQRSVERRYLQLPSLMRKSLIEPVLSAVSPETAWKLARAEKFFRDGGGYLNDHTTQFSEPALRALGFSGPIPAPAQRAFFDSFSGDRQSAALFADLNTYLSDDLMTLLDRTSMAVGVEGRVPYLDHRLVAAALAVPPHVRTPGDRQKALQRKIAAPYLPESVLRAPKRGFASPVPAWFQGGLAPVASRLLKSRQALDRGWWRPEAVDKLLADSQRNAFRLYTLLILEMTVRIHVDQSVRERAPGVRLDDFADAA